MPPRSPSLHADVVVIGAGAAGMMAAATASQRGRRVVLIDHAPQLAEKIRISGGGRCNFTNLHCTPDNFLSQNPHFCRSALARYGPKDFLQLVERHGIAWHEKTLGQLFCDDSSQNIIDMLVAECEDARVTWRRPCKVQHIRRAEDHGFELDTDAGPLRCDSLIIATGGLAIPQIGSTPFGYEVAQQFGIKVIPPRPALVPLTLDASDLAIYGELSGLAFDARTTLGKRQFRERVLLTHRGLSGPAILQISSYWQAQEGARDPIEIDLLPDTDPDDWLHQHQDEKSTLGNLLSRTLPQRFAKTWANAHAPEQPFNQLPLRTRTLVAHALKSWRIAPSGTLGFKKAEVTLGGVDTQELSSKTLEAKRVPGLYFIGEVVDVTGHLGGFNFQWAWSSGQAAGSFA